MYFPFVVIGDPRKPDASTLNFTLKQQASGSSETLTIAKLQGVEIQKNTVLLSSATNVLRSTHQSRQQARAGLWIAPRTWNNETSSGVPCGRDLDCSLCHDTLQSGRWCTVQTHLLSTSSKVSKKNRVQCTPSGKNKF